MLKCYWVLVATVLMAGCDSSTSVSDEAITASQLSGVWVRAIEGQQDKLEGLVLESDGKLGLIGIHSMNGVDWQLRRDALQLRTNTERYPLPEESLLEIAQFDGERLQLTGSDYLAGDYRRDDTAAGIVEGSISYLQRAALPDSAVVVLTLEDVSRADAPSELVANQVIATLGRQVPIPYRIYYRTADIDNRHSYSVRATIVVDGQRRYITDTAYPVITRDSGQRADIKLVPLQRAPKKSVTGLNPPALFQGDLPTASGSGVRETLQLRPDGIYQLSRHYLQEQDVDYSMGRWHYQRNGQQIWLRDKPEYERRYQIVDGDTLEMLDRQGKPIQSDLNYRLGRTRDDRPLLQPHPLQGYFSYMADAGRFVECRTGVSWPVAHAADNAALERAYSAARQEPGAPVLVAVMGHLEQQPKMEGTGTREMLVVDSFGEVLTDQGCELPPISEFADTRYGLIELNGKAAEVLGDQGEPHLYFSGNDNRLRGSGGCNGLNGRYQRQGNSLRLDEISFTEMACEQGMEQEQRFFEALQQVVRFELTGQTLVFYTKEGKPLARFEARYE